MSFEDNPWEPNGENCPADCGEPLEERGWFDDDPANGGACIGTSVQCTHCDFYEDR